MLNADTLLDEEKGDMERLHLLPKESQDFAEAALPGQKKDSYSPKTPYEDGITIARRNTWSPPLEPNFRPGLTEAERKALARKRVQRIFKLPLTFKKPQSSSQLPDLDISPTPLNSTAEETKRFQHKRPGSHFLITDYNKTQIQVKCQKDFEGAERPDWSVVRWIHLDSMNTECLPLLKANLPAPILIKDITRPSNRFRVEEHERYVLMVLHLVESPEEAAASRRSLTEASSSSMSMPTSKRNRAANEISTIRLIVYLFFEANTLVTVTETPATRLADCILTRLSREPSRIRNSDCSYLLYWLYIIKFTLTPFQMIINYHSQYLEMMEDKITYQHMEVASYQNIFHEIHEIRRELQHLRTRLTNIYEAIDDVREIAEREHQSNMPVAAAAAAFVNHSHSQSNSNSNSSTPAAERNGIFPNRLKLASVVRLQFKHLSSNCQQMATQTTTLQEISHKKVCSWLADLVFQTLSQKMNQTMKTLTLISMIFIPLTFIVGVYGTNFEFLPELRWKYGYVFLWGICLSVVMVELVLFRRLRWI